MGLNGTIVEVRSGQDFTDTKNILSRWAGKYYSIVSRSAKPGIELLNNELRQDMIIQVIGSNDSSAYLQLFVDFSVDAIIIDAADTQYYDLLLQLQLWWSKAKASGIIFILYYDHNRILSTAAVHEFSRKMNAPIFSAPVSESNIWYIVKPTK